ncbi:MAG: YbaK/EbsC family protein [Clostridia bacterium]
MSVERVKEYLKQFGKDGDVMEKELSSATVELAAIAVGVSEGEITKTLAFDNGQGGCILVAAAGDTKINNGKFKKQFGIKAKMLSPEDTLRLTGHAVGGVCPFANPEGAKAYIDISVKRFDVVYPACGSGNSMVGLTCDELFKCAKAVDWVDVCKLKDE